MPEESTFWKYACPKLKLSRQLWDLNSSLLSLVNYVKGTNRKIFPELNSKKHTPSPTIDFYEIAELPKTWVLQKRNRAILREMSFANDCANCCFFRAKLMRKERKFYVSFRKNCAKVLRMETLTMKR